MNKFFSFIIRQSVAIVLIVAFVLGFGVYATLKMPINLLPDINVPMVCVQIIYPGANAQSVEKDVTENLEEGLSAIGGVTSVDSYSYDNLSAVVLSFDYGTDTKEKQSEINSKLTSIELPEGVTSDVYDIDLNAEALAVLSVTSGLSEDGDKNLESAYSAAESMAASIAAIDGVESVEIKGGPQRVFEVRTRAGFETSAPLIVETFSYGALNIPIGNVTQNGNSVQVRNNDEITSMDDVLNAAVTLPEEICSVFAGVRTRLAGFLSLYSLDINDSATAQGIADGSIIKEGMPVFDIIKNIVKNSYKSDISDDLLKLVILKPFEEGKPLAVTVGDIATVEEVRQFGSYVYFGDGDTPQVIKGCTIEVYKSNGANSSAVVEKVKEVYTEYLGGAEAESLKADVRLLDDQSEFISDSISNVLVSMLIGGALAVVVIFLFLKKVRTSLIIAVTMPLSVLAAMICLFAMGITLNMVSLGGLAVGIGMLVDNSIVVIESISKHRDMDKTAFRAAVDGTTEVGGALFGSTLTTVCVFIPIIFSGGLTGEIFTDLAYAVIFSLSLSLIVAVTVIPALYALLCGERRRLKGGRLSKSLAGAGDSSIEPVEETHVPEQPAEPEGEEPEQPAKPRKKFKMPDIMGRVTGLYAKILPAAIKRKFVPILTAVIIFGASIGLLFLTGTEFLPSIDKGQIAVNMAYDSGTPLEEIQSDVSAFAQKIEGEFAENLDYISVSVGKQGLLALTDTGLITVQLKTSRGTQESVSRIRELTDGVKGKVTVKEIDGVVASLMSGSDDLSVTVLGEDADGLKQIASEISDALEKEGFKDIKSSAAEKAWQADIKFDRAKLASYGLDYQTVVLTLRIGMSSYTACTANIIKDGREEEYSVNVLFNEQSITDAESLKNFVVGYNTSSATPSPILLKDVATVGDAQEVEACIRRADGREMISVSAVYPGLDTGAAGDKMKEVASNVLSGHEGYDFQQSGISSYLNDAFSGLAVALVISFFLLYAVMAVQFGSAVKPLIIMASIPFSFTGGFLALVITGTSLNVVSFIGLIMLMGVVVNNAIVMLEKIKQLHESGMEHYDAVTEACKVRLRPILMTTLTTILALIPLAIGVGKGSELMQPLGIVVIGGLLVGTLVTLVLVPAVYCAVNRIGARKK